MKLIYALLIAPICFILVKLSDLFYFLTNLMIKMKNFLKYKLFKYLFK